MDISYLPDPIIKIIKEYYPAFYEKRYERKVKQKERKLLAEIERPHRCKMYEDNRKVNSRKCPCRRGTIKKYQCCHCYKDLCYECRRVCLKCREYFCFRCTIKYEEICIKCSHNSRQ